MINNINSNIKIQQNFFTRRYSWQYQIDLKPCHIDLLQLIRDLSLSLNSILQNNSILKNIKGRDRLNTISSKLELPFEQELLACNLNWNPAKFGLDIESANSEHSCGFFLLTPFDSFSEKDIFHKVIQATTGEAPHEISLNQILTDERLELKSFRLGIDTFGQSSFANWFISSPVVLEGIIIEAGSEEIQLRIQSEGHKSKEEGIYNYYDLISNILDALKSLLNFDLRTDLEKKLKY